jgi:hypothetical protein
LERWSVWTRGGGVGAGNDVGGDDVVGDDYDVRDQHVIGTENGLEGAERFSTEALKC